MEGCGGRVSPPQTGCELRIYNGQWAVLRGSEMAAIGLAPYYVHRLATSVGMCQELSCELRTLSA